MRSDDLRARADFSRLDLETGPLPYPDATFRLVICAHVLEHLHDPEHAVREMRRVLAPGGHLYVEVPSERTARAPSMPCWLGPGPSLAFHDDPTHVGQPWSPDQLSAFLSERRFQVLQTGRARSPGLWPAAPLFLVFGTLARNPRAVHRALEQLAGLASFAVAGPV